MKDWKGFLTNYKCLIANYLRQQEAAFSRGQLDRLRKLDDVTNDELLAKWAWLSTIAGAALCFFLLPVLVNIFRFFIPYFMMQVLWALTKVGMALTFLMFCLAIYLTVVNTSSR